MDKNHQLFAVGFVGGIVELLIKVYVRQRSDVAENKMLIGIFRQFQGKDVQRALDVPGAVCGGNTDAAGANDQRLSALGAEEFARGCAGIGFTVSSEIDGPDMKRRRRGRGRCTDTPFVRFVGAGDPWRRSAGFGWVLCAAC